MDKPITYECTKCGRKFVESAKGKGHTVPIYCCGKTIRKNKKKVTAKKNTSIKAKKK